MSASARLALTVTVLLALGSAPLCAQSAKESVVDTYPGATMFPPGTIATITQPPGLNSRIGPGATPRGIAFPVEIGRASCRERVSVLV